MPNEQDIRAEEKLLDELLDAGDERAWTGVAVVLRRIQDWELWRGGGYHSFSAWVKSYAARRGCTESLLWKYAKAGRAWERAREAEPSLPPLEKADVSARTVATAEKIGGEDARKMAGIIGSVVRGEVKPKQVEEQWRAVRKVAGVRKSRHAKAARAESSDGDAAMTARVTQALARDARAWVWGAHDAAEADARRARDGRQMERLEPVAVVTMEEFPVRVETAERARRIDLAAVCAENQTTADWMDVALRGVEVKVSGHDLERDEKMGDYGLFCDYMYIAAPSALVGEAADTVPPTWGVLEYVPEQDRIAVVREPVRLGAPRREEALATAVVKLATRNR